MSDSQSDIQPVIHSFVLQPASQLLGQSVSQRKLSTQQELGKEQGKQAAGRIYFHYHDVFGGLFFSFLSDSSDSFSFLFLACYSTRPYLTIISHIFYLASLSAQVNHLNPGKAD